MERHRDSSPRRRPASTWTRLGAALMIMLPQAGLACEAERAADLVPRDAALCERLDPVVRDPSGLPLGEYEETLSSYFDNFCHRRPDIGWVPDKRVRGVGPLASMLVDGVWKGQYHGTHAPVLIWYSPEMADWVRANRALGDEGTGPDAAPVPAGAIIVKEMYDAPASTCADVAPERLLPSNGAAIMVRDAGGAHDGWFWGWYGWSGWSPDWPASNDDDRLPNMGFGQYCMNCHASARDNLTFSAARNMKGEPGEITPFLVMDEGPVASPGHHAEVVLPEGAVRRLGTPRMTYDPAFAAAFPPLPDGAPGWDGVAMMPPETYDNVWMPADGPPDHGQFLTSDQCLGCHDAGSTGLHYDMTESDPASGKLLNLSPYGTWRSSPMGLAGRDPIFFAQLASETQSFHPDEAALVQDVCLGCHGVLGQRQFHTDRMAETGACDRFGRDAVAAVPYPPGNPDAGLADYGALARDGISCMSCHQMALGKDAAAPPERNACVDERQALLNPDATGFARTFTGSFPVGPADRLIGPFEDPKTAPMKASLGIEPAHDGTIASSDVCGTCHTVHLPVFREGETVGRVYEQTTYPEWAFSAYRTGESVDGSLPHGAGDKAESCQACHMPAQDADGQPTMSKIASIQEFEGFPKSEFTRAPDEIDLEPREGFARHTLVGLNVFFVKMAQQFPDVLGIRTEDPMMVSMGVDPLIATEQAMLDQAAEGTASLSFGTIETVDGTLRVPLTITSHVGHKFPSGVGFRRAFVSFEVTDAAGRVLWASGRTDGAGRLVDAEGTPLDGEVWWEADCSARIDPLERRHQPHYQTIGAETEAQIYQELVSTPPEGEAPSCGHDAAPAGQLTTSFLSICAEVKDNRLLPEGYLPLEERTEIAEALGAGADLAADAGSTAVGDDPDYVTGGGDTLEYAVPLDALAGEPVGVRARLYYQATPPFYLQDRFCSATGADRDRLYFLAGHLDLSGTEAEGWKLGIADTKTVPLP